MEWKTLLSATRAGRTADAAASRSAFEQDFDRIVFSHPFRKLQDKTQVHPLPEHDFVHTRLTHSLEASSVGRSLGKKAGEVILQRHPALTQAYSLFDFGAIVAAAALAHDIGNPPFGHAGEEAISEFFRNHPQGQAYQARVTEKQWQDLVRFEGNAQGFRLLNNKEPSGMKLTAACLGAFTKYPCPALLHTRDTQRKSQKKFGFFQSEETAFRQLASDLGLTPISAESWSRHPLAFLVEAADDICYSIIDLEDACRLGLVRFEETVALLAGILGSRLDRDKLASIQDLNQKLGILRSLAIGALIDSCTEIFLDHEEKLLQGRFDRALTDLSVFQSDLAEISRISVDRIYRAPHVIDIEASGHQVLPGLLEEFAEASRHILDGIPSRKYENLQRMLPPDIAASIRGSNDAYNMLRHVIDFISGLTDRHALSLYRRIKGISL